MAASSPDEPYFIEVDSNGCPHCGAGRTWLIIEPDGLGGPVSYSDEEEAAEIAEMLNDAYARGRVAAVPKTKRRKKTNGK